MLALHLAMHIALSKHPDLKVRILGIVDDLDLLGTIRDCVIIYFDLKVLFKELFGTNPRTAGGRSSVQIHRLGRSSGLRNT